jgi:hypothetical protein
MAMSAAALVAISGPKNVLISGPTPYNGPRNDIARLKNIKYPAIENNRYISSY